MKLLNCFYIIYEVVKHCVTVILTQWLYSFNFNVKACSKSMCTALVLIQAVCTTLAIKKNILKNWNGPGVRQYCHPFNKFLHIKGFKKIIFINFSNLADLHGLVDGRLHPNLMGRQVVNYLQPARWCESEAGYFAFYFCYTSFM